MSTVLYEPDPEAARHLRSALTAGDLVASYDALRLRIDTDHSVDAVVLGPSVEQHLALDLAEALRVPRPALGVILVRRRADATVLTAALRAGVREVVAERDLHGLQTAVDRVTTLAQALRTTTPDVESSAGTSGGRCVTVFAAKGGAGKTTVSTNLAAALADDGRRNVCIVDLDLSFGDVAIALQMFPQHTLADAVPMAETLDEAGLAGLLTSHSPGLSALVAPVEPGLAETIPAPLVGRVLRMLKRTFDYVVVDTPPAFTDHVLAALDESEMVVLITTLDIPALKNLKIAMETLDLLTYPRDRWSIVLNRADAKVGLAVEEVSKTLQMPIAVQIPSSRDVPASVNRGVPIVLDSPRHEVSVAIRRFVDDEVVPHMSPDEAVPSGLRTDRRGLLRRRARTS